MKLKKIITLAWMVTFFAFCPLLLAEQIILEKGAITFDVPAGFTKLTAKEIQIKFPSAKSQTFVVGNKDRTVTAAYGLTNIGTPPEKLTDTDLPDFQKGMAQGFNSRVPNMMIVTFFRGQMFIVNFNSTKSEFQKVGAELKRCIQTLIVKN